jgi:hypothetical protein
VIEFAKTILSCSYLGQHFLSRPGQYIQSLQSGKCSQKQQTTVNANTDASVIRSELHFVIGNKKKKVELGSDV